MHSQETSPTYRAGVLVAALLVLSVAATAAAQPSDEIVARLGSSDIRISDLKDFVRSLDPVSRQQAANDPQLLTRLVRIELARMAVLKEAKQKHWDEEPNVVAQLERARNQAIVSSYVASIAEPPANFPSDAEVQAAYEQTRDRFMLPRQYHLAQIFVALAAGSDKKAEQAAEQRAQDLVKKAKARNASFADLARKSSDQAETAKNGGDLGWLLETQLVPEVRSAVSGLAAGEVSNAIRAGDGWHVIQLIETKPAGPRPLTEVHDSLVLWLRQKKGEENGQAYLAALLERNHVVVNEIALFKVLDLAK